MADEKTQPSPQEAAPEPQAAEAPAAGQQPQQAPSAPAAGAPQPKAPEPAVTVEDSGPLKKKVTVSVSRRQIEAKFEEMFGELGHSALVPGFRIGHAPRRLIEKRFGREVSRDVRDALVGESLGTALEKADLKPLGEPELKLEEIELPDSGDLTYCFEVEVQPEFALPDYKGIAITRPAGQVSDRNVEQVLAEYRRSCGVLRPVDAPVQPDDMVIADVTVAGEQIQHRRPNLELRVAPAQVDGILLEDLPKVLTGRRAGEAIRTATRVPAGHPRPEWQNKEVTVSLEIKEVKRLEVPPADDALARRLGYGSLEELSEGVRANLQRRLAEQQRAAMHEQVCRYLMERAALDLPEGAASRLGERALARRYVDLLHRGVPREEIEGNLERLQAVADQQARSELKLALILAKVCEAEKIELDEGEVNARIAEIARRYNRRPERLRQEMDQEGRLDDLKTFLREEKAIERILESASITDGPVSPPEEPEAPAEPPQVEPGPGAQVQVREEPAAVSAEVAAPAGVGQEPRPEPPQAEEPEGAAEPEGAEEPQAVEEQAQAEARPPAEEAKPGKPATKARAKKKPPAGKAKPARKAAPAGKRKGRGKGKDKGR